MEIEEERNVWFWNYKRRKSGSGRRWSSNCSFLRIPYTDYEKIERERTRRIIRLLGGMQSGRLWGTKIAGLEQCLGGLVACFQKTNVPLEVEEERHVLPSHQYSSRLDIISSHRRIMQRHTSPGCALVRQREGYCLLLFLRPLWNANAIILPWSLPVPSFSPLRVSHRDNLCTLWGIKSAANDDVALRDLVDRSWEQLEDTNILKITIDYNRNTYNVLCSRWLELFTKNSRVTFVPTANECTIVFILNVRNNLRVGK